MKREDLRKVKYVTEYSEIYKIGYFHQWVVETYGNTYEGISTYVYALVEDEKGAIRKVEPNDIKFVVDEDTEEYFSI